MPNTLNVDPVIARVYISRVVPKLRSGIHLDPYEKFVEKTVRFVEKGGDLEGINLTDMKVSLNPRILQDYVEKVLPKVQADVHLNEYERLVQKAVTCIEKGDEKGLKSADELLGRYIASKK